MSKIRQKISMQYVVKSFSAFFLELLTIWILFLTWDYWDNFIWRHLRFLVLAWWRSTPIFPLNFCPQAGQRLGSVAGLGWTWTVFWMGESGFLLETEDRPNTEQLTEKWGILTFHSQFAHRSRFAGGVLFLLLWELLQLQLRDWRLT